MINLKRFLSIVAMVVAATASNIMAQQAVGTWKIHPIFGDQIQRLVDSKSKVFYLANNCLYAYDKVNNESETYNTQNYLHDTNITNIYYNHYKDYVLVAYANSNIDVILPSGKVVNMPDIKDAVITTAGKNINSVSFTSEAAYVATGFGYVVIDDNKFQVKESKIYNVSVTCVARTADYIVLNVANELYWGPASNNYPSIDTMLHTYSNAFDYVPIEGTNYILASTKNTSYRLKVTETYIGSTKLAEKKTTVQSMPDGRFRLMSNEGSFYVVTDAQGDNPQTFELPSEVHGELLDSYEGNGTWWTFSVNGLRHVKIEESAITILSDYFKPNAATLTDAFTLAYNKGLSKLFVSNTGKSALNPSASYNPYYILNNWDGSDWADVTPPHPTIKMRSLYQPEFAPADPEILYIPSEFNGIFKVKNGEVLDNYYWENSPLEQYANYNCATEGGVKFDALGNLWVIQANANIITVLPKERLGKETITKEDWIMPKVSFVADWRQVFTITQQSNIKLYNKGTWASPLVIFNDHGNPSAAKIDVSTYNSLTDQDGKSYSWNNIFTLTEDLAGMVWMGTNNGVVAFDPTKGNDPNFTVNHIKVPRTDGTGYADYLLDGLQVNCIAVDGVNRKWIGTDNAGLFLVSADGSQVLKEFNTSNSVLPSNKIYAVACNPNNNSVYVGTNFGVLEYSSDATAPSSDFSNVYAFPNPVRPEYTGLITITGLMDDSLVKITDAYGNVVANLQSQGGMATWDGCNFAGEKVKTGVYYVMASESSNDSKSGKLATKILIVR